MDGLRKVPDNVPNGAMLTEHLGRPLTRIPDPFGKFDSLAWVDKDWTVSADGGRVFLQAQSEGVASHSKAPYRNTYVIRFDIVGERIVQILEYALDDVFLALEIPPGDWDKRAIALARTLPYRTVVDSSIVESGN